MTTDRLFVCWVRHHGRSIDVAADLSARCVFIAVGRSGNKWTAPARYVLQAIRTILLLAVERPRVLICMAPPDTLMVIGRLYCRLARARFAIDAHSGAVLRKSDGSTRPSFVRLARSATTVIVTNTAVGSRLVGATTNILGNPPGSCLPTTQGPRPIALFPCGWAHDEPLEALYQAADLLPEVAIVVTGRPKPAMTQQLGDPPPNLRLTGFLSEDAYGEVLASASVVLALTTREETMQQAGYEALRRHLPLVASASQVLKDYFSAGTVLTTNDATSLAAAVSNAIDNAPRLRAEMAALHEEKAVEHNAQLEALRARLSAIGSDPHSASSRP